MLLRSSPWSVCVVSLLTKTLDFELIVHFWTLLVSRDFASFGHVWCSGLLLHIVDFRAHHHQSYEAISNQSENCHVHDQPRRSWVVDLRQLISFTFSVQTGQLASLVIMTILTLVGYCLVYHNRDFMHDV